MPDDRDRPADDEANRTGPTDADTDEYEDSDAGVGDRRTTTDPDHVREWAETRGAVPAMAPDASGPEAYSLQHENVVDGGAHERVGWDDFLASLRGDDVAFHHSTDRTEGEDVEYHEFVARDETGSDADADVATRGDEAERGADTATTAEELDSGAGTPTDASPGEATAETEADPIIPDAEPADDAGEGDRGTVAGDSEGGIESGATADRDETDAGSDTDRRFTDVSEGDSVVDGEGDTVGIVTAVHGDTLYVDPDPSLTEKLSAKLGWTGEDDAEYTLHVDDVAETKGGDVELNR